MDQTVKRVLALWWAATWRCGVAVAASAFAVAGVMMLLTPSFVRRGDAQLAAMVAAGLVFLPAWFWGLKSALTTSGMLDGPEPQTGSVRQSRWREEALRPLDEPVVWAPEPEPVVAHEALEPSMEYVGAEFEPAPPVESTPYEAQPSSSANADQDADLQPFSKPPGFWVTSRERKSFLQAPNWSEVRDIPTFLKLASEEHPVLLVFGSLACMATLVFGAVLVSRIHSATPDPVHLDVASQSPHKVASSDAPAPAPPSTGICSRLPTVAEGAPKAVYEAFEKARATGADGKAAGIEVVGACRLRNAYLAAAAPESSTDDISATVEKKCSPTYDALLANVRRTDPSALFVLTHQGATGTDDQMETLHQIRDWVAEARAGECWKDGAKAAETSSHKAK